MLPHSFLTLSGGGGAGKRTAPASAHSTRCFLPVRCFVSAQACWALRSACCLGSTQAPFVTVSSVTLSRRGPQARRQETLWLYKAHRPTRTEAALLHAPPSSAVCCLHRIRYLPAAVCRSAYRAPAARVRPLTYTMCLCCALPASFATARVFSVHWRAAVVKWCRKPKRMGGPRLRSPRTRPLVQVSRSWLMGAGWRICR